MRKLLAAALAAFVVLAPAAHAKGERVTTFKITRAEGHIRVSFHGDEAAGCRERGVCGVSGTVTRAYGERTSGQLHWLQLQARTLIAHAFIDGGQAEVVADVGTAGSAERCVDRVRTRFDSFELRPRRGRLVFRWGGAGGGWIVGTKDEDGEPVDGMFLNPFGTRCSGPEFLDVEPALPRSEIPFRVLRSLRSSFRVTGVQSFAAGGFAGTVSWDLAYRLRRGSSRVFR